MNDQIREFNLLFYNALKNDDFEKVEKAFDEYTKVVDREVDNSKPAFVVDEIPLFESDFNSNIDIRAIYYARLVFRKYYIKHLLESLEFTEYKHDKKRG